MATTLTRSITETMEEDLYTPSSDQQSQPHQSQPQSQNDYLQYLSLPNMSQESITRVYDYDDQSQQQFQQQQQIPQPTQNISGNDESINTIYNTYGNPNTFTDHSLMNNLYNNIESIDMTNNNYDYNDLINPQFTSSINNQNNLNNGIEDLLSTPNYNNNNNINYNQLTNNIQDLKDDVLMVSQDNFYIYDQHDPQLIPEMMELEIPNKSFQHSNELNLFKANDVLYEFSDDEDDDDDIDLQNKLDDDDMEMKFDDDEDDDYEKFSPNLNFNSNNNSSPNELTIADNYLAPNDLEVENENQHANSIYSLTVPNQLSNSDESFNFNQSQPFQISSPLSNYNDIELYESDDHDDEEDDEYDENDSEINKRYNLHKHDEYEDDDDEDDEHDSDDEYAIEMDDNDAYSPIFKERRESVTADKFVIKKERSKSMKSSTRPKRIRRASNKLSTPSVMTSLRKPRHSSTEKQSPPTDIGFENDEDKEDHVCVIPNPKSGKPCLKRFSRPYDLVRHQNTIHASKRSFYRCMFCEDDLRRKHDLDSVNEIVVSCKYRTSRCSIDNSQSHVTSSHNVKKIKSGVLNNSGYLSNKTFSRCDALTRHLRFRHGLTNNQVNDAMSFAKKHVEFYDN